MSNQKVNSISLKKSIGLQLKRNFIKASSEHTQTRRKNDFVVFIIPHMTTEHTKKLYYYQAINISYQESASF